MLPRRESTDIFGGFDIPFDSRRWRVPWFMCIPRVLLVATFVLIAAPGAVAQSSELYDVEDFLSRTSGMTEDERLTALFDDMWSWQMEDIPEMATYRGYPGQNHRWTDQSREGIADRREQMRRFLQALQRIDVQALDERPRLDHALILRSVEQQVDGQRFPNEVMPVTQMGGPQQGVPNVIAVMPTSSVRDYENIIARLRAVPALIQQTIEQMEEGLRAGITPPQITLREVPDQVRNVLTEEPEAGPLMAPFTRIPDAIPASEKERLWSEARAALAEDVYPAFERLHDYLVETYVPGARQSVGLSDVPEGAAWYAHNIRQYTTTGMTAQEIHDIGLSEVQRIRHEMQKIMQDAGFDGDLDAFFEFLRSDPRFFFETPEDLIVAYRDISKRADAELPRLFWTLPRLPYGVRAVPSFAERSQTTAYYQPGSHEAGRAGIFFANTYDLGSRPKWEMEALSLHEAVPGHHLQIALAQELPETHDLRRNQFYTAFVEGWGLYAESLGEEMGFYQDPYSKFGQLTYEMWRAVRLVVDTGMHALGWSRDQAIDFFASNAGKTEHDIVVEVDRYIVWPGQALAYKVGELKIKELRARAENALGEAFDVRRFHDALLMSGALPLDVLEERIDAWIREQQHS